MDFKDYYTILGVDEKSDLKTIKTAYRKLARKYHPDISKEDNAEAQFKEVAEAYEVLKDTQKRAEYDELRRYASQRDGGFTPPPDWQQSGHGAAHFEHFEGDFSEFFESIFGGARHRPPPTGYRGQDVELELPIFLEDTLSEEARKISYKIASYNQEGEYQGDVTKTLSVKVPKGVSDGERIRVKGQGSPGGNGGGSGDLYLHIRLVPHPLFDVEGHNLIVTVPIAPWEAALGTKIKVPTLTGSIQLTVPGNTQAGNRLRIKGHGLANKGGRGDLHAVFKIVIPDKSDDKLKLLWEQLADSTDFDPRLEWSKS